MSRENLTTLAAARAHRYNCWGGNPKGNAYEEGRCAATVCTGGRAPSFLQCRKPNGQGPEGLYCKAHAAKLDGTAYLVGTKVVYWFGVPCSSYQYKDRTPRLWAFNVRPHGKDNVKVTTPHHGSVLPGFDTVRRASFFADTPEAALAAYTVKCREAHSRALDELAKAAKAVEECPTEPGEPGEIKD